MKFIKFLKLCFGVIAPDSHYLSNWHIRAISDRLEATLDGKINRLIINVPPRSMKSICVSIAWPAWILGLNPKSRIIVASYSQILSEKLSLDTRYILQSPWYKELFPEVQISKEENKKSRFQTTQLGYRFATSIGGSITGEGGNFLIVDDPMNPLQSESEVYRQRVCEWFNQSLLTRLNDRKKGAVILVMHRLHTDDLTGYLLKKSNKWHHLSIPLVADKKSKIYSLSMPRVLKNGRNSRKILYTRGKGEPLRKTMSERYIDNLKKDVGAYAYSAQYQQNPIDTLGRGLILRKWFKRYETPFDVEQATIVQSWDTAVTTGQNSDFSVCTTWAFREKNFFLLEVQRSKVEYTALKRLVLHLEALWKPSAILIEKKSSGSQLIQELHHLPIISLDPIGTKVTRTHQVMPLIESGHVFLPYDSAWLSEFEQEVCSFPKSRNDDQVDSMIQFLSWAYQLFVRANPQIRALT